MHKFKSLQKLKIFAKDLAKRLTFPYTLGLTGELGAGKTTFTKFLCQALGVTEEITSPTYVLQHEYKSGDLTIEHWDLYRVKTLPLELQENSTGKVLRIIEWVDLVEDYQEFVDEILEL